MTRASGHFDGGSRSSVINTIVLTLMMCEG